MNKQRIATLVAAGFGALVCFLPWIKVLNSTKVGIEGDGIFALIAFVIVIFISLIGDRTKVFDKLHRVGVAGLGLVATIFPIFIYGQFQDKIQEAQKMLADNPFGGIATSTASVETGLYLAIFAGLALVVIAIITPVFENKTAKIEEK